MCIFAETNQEKRLMCRFNISIDDAVMEKVRPHFHSEQAVQRWLEQQVQILVAQFVRDSRSHQRRQTWTDYKLSPEIEAMAPRKRKPIYGEYKEYKEQLTNILEEEYQ